MANSGEAVENLENSEGDREDLNLWHGGNELIDGSVKEWVEENK